MIKRLAKPAALAALGLTALTALAAPYPQGANDTTPVTNLERTIHLRTRDGAREINLKLPDLKDGETRVIAAEDGRPVTITRKGRELTVNADGKDIKVVLPDDSTPLPASGQKMVVVKQHEDASNPSAVTKKVIIVKDSSLAPGEPVSAQKVLQGAKLKSYDRLDPKTRAAVDEVVQELLEKGTVLAPGVLIDSAKGGDVKVDIRKEEKKN